jgi:hypothetical protein
MLFSIYCSSLIFKSFNNLKIILFSSCPTIATNIYQNSQPIGYAVGNINSILSDKVLSRWTHPVFLNILSFLCFHTFESNPSLCLPIALIKLKTVYYCKSQLERIIFHDKYSKRLYHCNCAGHWW